ncbi:MAG: transporter substrate-binding domain-containing protein [Lachnospiraceae bacterium]|nr:transporter substrate-binding domain-containing protein [Lachnospiraceae bacterium]
MKKKSISIIISTLLVAALLFCLSACGSKTPYTPTPSGSGAASGNQEAAVGDLAKVQGAGKIVIGVTDFAPMDYKENGAWVGFDAELSELFAESLGVKAEFVEIDWDNKILELNGGSVDCIWNGMTLTPEVGNAMSCTDTYALNAQVVVMAADKLDQYPDAASMASLSFAAEAGSAGEEVGLDAGFNVNSVQNQAAALMEVAAGTSDACIIDKTMADAMTGEGTSYTNLGYKVSLSSEEYVVGFRKGSDLTQKLNDLFAQWKADGTLKAMSEKYDNAVSIVE